MVTKRDDRKRAEVMIANAIAKRNYATKLWGEAEEELIEARMLLEDLEKEEPKE